MTMRALLLCATFAGCVGSGELTASVSGQVVGLDDVPFPSGLVLIEKGKVHEGAYQTGALIGEDGRFSADLSEGGTWGLHLFHDEHYSYLPVEITIADGQQIVLKNADIDWGAWLDKTGQPSWPDQPEDAALTRLPFDDNLADNPIIHSIAMEYPDSETMLITLDVSDPTGDLSRMILAYDPATHNGFALSPPGPPNERGEYPNGIYTLTVFLEDVHVPGESQWYFIVSDNPCNNSPINIVTMPER